VKTLDQGPADTFDLVYHLAPPCAACLRSRGCFAPQRGQNTSFLPSGWPQSWHLRSSVIINIIL